MLEFSVQVTKGQDMINLVSEGPLSSADWQLISYETEEDLVLFVAQLISYLGIVILTLRIWVKDGTELSIEQQITRRRDRSAELDGV